MSITKKLLSAVFCIGLLAAGRVAAAGTDVDLRLKFGSAAGADKFEVAGIPEVGSSQQDSGNFQVEVAVLPRTDSGIGFVGTLGIFGREHKGQVNIPFMPTDVKYDASGLSGSVGVSIPAAERVHFEGRVELALGQGKPTLSTPGVVWNATKEGDYTAASLIVGGYYTFSKPSFQLGLELGAQSFEGKFKIWNNVGAWSDGKVKGSGGTANLVLGYRF